MLATTATLRCPVVRPLCLACHRASGLRFESRSKSSRPRSWKRARDLLHQIRWQHPHAGKALSERQKADLEERLVAAVGRNVKDPVLQRDLASLSWLTSRSIGISENGESVQILLRLPSLLHPDLDHLKDEVFTEAIGTVQKWNEETGHHGPPRINVQAVATSPVPFMSRIVEDPAELIQQLGPGLENVAHVLAVYSCKGGVGKSTVAVNLAYELALMGGRVGLLDLDLYGPSLPLLVNPEDKAVRRSPKQGLKMVYPIEHQGVRLLSLGFVNKNSGVQGSGRDNGAAILRGPLVIKVVAQLLKGTDWGELDVLVLDLPPGTGDVQLAVCQDLALSGAVAVSTPSKLATVDTRKGIEMFTSLGVPTLAVVENMSYFVCEGGNTHYPFGRGLSNDDAHVEKLSPTVQLPISPPANDATESGQPLCLARPNSASDELRAFRLLAKTVSRELLRVQYGDTEPPDLVSFADDSTNERFSVASVHLSLDKTSAAAARFTARFFSSANATQRILNPVELRVRDPKSGDIIDDSPFMGQRKQGQPDPMVLKHAAAGPGDQKVSPSLTPVKVERKGRYGYAVQWADGATIIYSKSCISRASGGSLIESQ